MEECLLQRRSHANNELTGTATVNARIVKVKNCEDNKKRFWGIRNVRSVPKFSSSIYETCVLQNCYSDESNYNSAVSSSSSSPSCETESEPLNALSNSSSSEMVYPIPQSTYAGGISFWYTNATSLNNKIPLLKTIAASLTPSIIGITETWPPDQISSISPSDSDTAIATSLELTTNLFRNGKFPGIILIGDFNISHAEWNDFAAPVLDVQSACYHVVRSISESSIVQMVKEETFFSKDPNRVSDAKRGPPLDGYASRYYCSLSFQLHSKEARPQSFDSRALHWRSGDFAAMNQYFKDQNWWRISEKGSVKDLYSDFLHIFRQA
ncbi:hypothetical protein BpHYR1_048484, partial [Brachionus plicatilis]